MDSLVDYTQYLDDFRTSRKIYMKIANSANDWEGLRNHDDGLIIKNLLAKRHIVIKRFVQKLTMLQNKNRLHNSKDDIMASIIHLHCNRILGINRVYERKLMTLARHALHNLKYFKQKNNLIQIQQTVKKEGVLL